MKKYKMQTWKLIVEGEYSSEEEAIKDLADKYMRCSKCDAPGNHPIEHLDKRHVRTIDGIAKAVYFFVQEEVYGINQWVQKYQMSIYPFTKDHWWPCEGFEGPEREFKYEIKKGDKS